MFDEIMKSCPYLKEVIENKIKEEIAKKEVENEDIKKTLDILLIENLNK